MSVDDFGLRPRFQHSPRNLANVSEWIITFDPYIKNYYEAKVGTRQI